MTAPLMFEPTDPPDLPVIPIPAAEFDHIAARRGAVIELDAGGRDVVIVDGVEWEVAR